ncbi:MAG: hypothetical protein HYR96_04370 [Deltaproteobacteria bacterium]|nr:hypothetical protein [Deltaproteobacteria bacterium]MBI3295415.1 hypothetical protein [Deltaproteobacteria bacterium]
MIPVWILIAALVTWRVEAGDQPKCGGEGGTFRHFRGEMIVYRSSPHGPAIEGVIFVSVQDMGPIYAADSLKQMDNRLARVRKATHEGRWNDAFKLMETTGFIEGLGVGAYDVHVDIERNMITRPVADQLMGDPKALVFTLNQLASFSHARLKAETAKMGSEIGVGTVSIADTVPRNHPLRGEIERERVRLILEEVGHQMQVVNQKASGFPMVSHALSDRAFASDLAGHIRENLAAGLAWEILNGNLDPGLVPLLLAAQKGADGNLQGAISRCLTKLEGDGRLARNGSQAELESDLKAIIGSQENLSLPLMRRALLEADVYIFLQEQLGKDNVPSHVRDRYFSRPIVDALLEHRSRVGY